jgi:hypothetical protein
MNFSEFSNFYYLKKNIISIENVPVNIENRLSMLPVFIGIANLPKIALTARNKKYLKKLLKNESK